MLPNLKSLQKTRNVANTPDLSAKRFQMGHSEHQDVHTLRSQIENLQRQLEYVQSNKSFVMKITTAAQCLTCVKLKQQLEVQQANEKVMRRSYEQKIEELQKLSQKQLSKAKSIEQDNRYEELLQKVKQIQQHELFISDDNQINFGNIPKIQFTHKNQTNEPTIQHLIKQNEDQNSIIAKYLSQIKQAEQQIDQQKANIQNLQNLNDHLKKQMRDLQEPKKSNHQTYEEYGQKMKTEPAQEKSMLQQLLFQNQSLKEKLIQQNQYINQQAQENQISKHLIRIELLETELRLSLRCCRCQNLFEKPRTYIPCGHSCCEKCYKPNCDKCDTEAVYRNRQFDELIKVYYIIKDTKVFIQGCLLQLQN